MKECKLKENFHPTTDMKKAIERNIKQEEDLSLVLKQIDVEKRLALGRLSRKQDAVKKQILKRQETLSKQFKVQLFEQEAANAEATDRPRLHEGVQKRPVRRSWSYDETQHASMVHLPALRNKRHSLPASAFWRTDDDALSLETGNTVISPQRISHKNHHKQSDETFQSRREVTSQFCKKSKNCTAQNAIRRHSAISFAATMENYNSRLLQRRRVTTHNLIMGPCIENEMETLIKL